MKIELTAKVILTTVKKLKGKRLAQAIIAVENSLNLIQVVRIPCKKPIGVRIHIPAEEPMDADRVAIPNAASRWVWYNAEDKTLKLCKWYFDDEIAAPTGPFNSVVEALQAAKHYYKDLD